MLIPLIEDQISREFVALSQYNSLYVTLNNVNCCQPITYEQHNVQMICVITMRIQSRNRKEPTTDNVFKNQNLFPIKFQ